MIFDESLIKEIINVLPILEPHEVYLMMLAVRGSKLHKELGTPKLKDTVLARQVVRAKDWPEKLLLGARRLSALAASGGYVIHGVTVKPEYCGILFTPNPRNALNAAVGLIEEIARGLRELYVSNDKAQCLHELSKIDVRFFAQLHKRSSRKLFLTIDVDEPDKYGEARDLVSSFKIAWISKTPKGYHIVLRLEGNDRADFYRQRYPDKIKSLGGVEIHDDPMEPLPGTIYRGHKVVIIE